MLQNSSGRLENEQVPAARRLLFDLLFAEMGDELRRRASVLCRLENSPSFSTGDLLSDLYLRLSNNPAYSLTIAERGRLEFMNVASQAMRNILIDAARKRVASKRGGSFLFVTLSNVDQPSQVSLSPELLLDLEDAMQVLEEKHPRRAAILRMRFYSGLSIEELKTYWGLADATVERDIHLALKLLQTLLASKKE